MTSSRNGARAVSRQAERGRATSAERRSVRTCGERQAQEALTERSPVANAGRTTRISLSTRLGRRQCASCGMNSATPISTEQRAAVSRAVRRDGLLEPARRDRQGRQGPCHLQGPVGPVGISHHGAGRHRRRNSGRPDHGDLDGTQELLRRSQGPGIADSRRQAAVHRARSINRRHRQARASAHGLCRRARGGFPKTIELTKDGVDEVVFEPFEVPDGESVRLTLNGHDRRHER